MQLDRLQIQFGNMSVVGANSGGRIATNVAIEAATAGDIGPLRQRFGQWRYFRDCLNRQARGDDVLFIARADGRPAGHGFLQLEDAEEPEIRSGLPGVPLITQLRVAYDSQGGGIGSELISRMEQYARSEVGRDRIALAVFPSNASARRLYQRLGYTDWGKAQPSATTLCNNRTAP